MPDQLTRIACQCGAIHRTTRVLSLGAGRDLLDGPAVAVRIVEEAEADIVERVGHRGRVRAEDLDIADFDTAFDQFGVGFTNIGNDELQALYRTRFHLRDRALADHDGAAGAG